MGGKRFLQILLDVPFGGPLDYDGGAVLIDVRVDPSGYLAQSAALRG